MNSSNIGQQIRYLEEVCISLHRAGFETKPPEDCQLPILWNDAPLCRITGKGSVYYRREDTDTPQAEDALFRIEDIAAKTLEYMTAMESAPRLKATDLTSDYRILADFGDAVLAGHPTERGVQFGSGALPLQAGKHRVRNPLIRLRYRHFLRKPRWSKNCLTTCLTTSGAKLNNQKSGISAVGSALALGIHAEAIKN